MRSIAVVVAAVFLAACSDGNRSRISIGVQGNTEALRPALSVTVTGIHGFTRTWQGAEITSQSAPNYTPAVQTPHVGQLDITARVAVAGDTTSARIQLDVRPDWEWGVDVWLWDHNPLDGCFGCRGARAFAAPAALQRSERDSLYLVWGGNSINHPVTY